MISITALAHLVRNILASDKPVHILGKAVLRAVRNRYEPDISKARQELSINVTVSLADVIRRMSGLR